MSFFYDLNKRMADLASKQDAKQIAEEVKATAPKSRLAESFDVAEAGYGAKAARAGKDIGKPGKNFSKIAKTAGAKYGSKAAGERVAGAVLNKLRHPTEEAAVPMTPKQKSFAKLAPPADKITFADKIAGAKKEVDEMLGDVAADAMRKAVRGKQQVADEGNAFTGKLKSTPKGGKFKMGNKEYTDTSEVDEGFKEMDAWIAQREKEKGTGKFDKKERTMPGGMKATTYTRKHEDDKEDNDDSKASQAEKYASPKKKGRPMGKPKGPERVTKGAWKHKGERKSQADEDLDTDGVMMTRPTNCSSEAAGDKSAIKAAIELLKKNGYNVSKKEAVDEKAVSQKQQKFMGMVHAAQKGEKAASPEVGKVAKTMKKKDAEDFASTKHKGLPEKVKAKKESKEEVEETTDSAGSSKGGFQFGKGVYESLDRQFKQALTEGMNVSVNMTTGEDGEARKNITISADGEDADKLAELLKMAGLGGQEHEGTCPGCGQSPCGCDAEMVDENSPDWPTNTEYTSTKQNMDPVSNDLNSNKSTGQTTIPVVASQLRRQVSMEENVKLERSLFKTWKNYKG